MTVSVVVRPPLYCAACGGAMWTAHQITPEQRTVRCLQRGCPQHNEDATITDPTITHLTPDAMSSLPTMVDLNPQPREH